MELLNRDVEWLEFNRRVMSEAIDPRNPLLERARYLDIFRSNLDEFFMKRMNFIRIRDERRPVADPDPVTAANLHKQIREAILDLLQDRVKCVREVIGKFAETGIHLLRWDQL